mmetsp:Transcript_39230/g.65138  ORF Transcript_39230/g.65138 Transcript_39230/m.65138 type:complete len:202 (+) Transcript_39230:431-1036(+)
MEREALCGSNFRPCKATNAHLRTKWRSPRSSTQSKQTGERGLGVLTYTLTGSSVAGRIPRFPVCHSYARDVPDWSMAALLACISGLLSFVVRCHAQSVECCVLCVVCCGPCVVDRLVCVVCCASCDHRGLLLPGPPACGCIYIAPVPWGGHPLPPFPGAGQNSRKPRPHLTGFRKRSKVPISVLGPPEAVWTDRHKANAFH